MLTDSLAEDDVLHMRIYRDGAAAADTMSEDASLAAAKKAVVWDVAFERAKGEM